MEISKNRKQHRHVSFQHLYVDYYVANTQDRKMTKQKGAFLKELLCAWYSAEHFMLHASQQTCKKPGTGCKGNINISFYGWRTKFSTSNLILITHRRNGRARIHALLFLSSQTYEARITSQS